MKTTKPATRLHGRRIILQGGYVFEVEHQHAEHLDVLQSRANAYPELVQENQRLKEQLERTSAKVLASADHLHATLDDLVEHLEQRAYASADLPQGTRCAWRRVLLKRLKP